jgi:formylglycine-generating enzyme required for sulfatase activity
VGSRDDRYADDYAGNIYEYVWDQWFKRMDPLPASVPYMVGPGNHEFSCMHPLCAVYSANFTAYNHRFRYHSLQHTTRGARLTRRVLRIIGVQDARTRKWIEHVDVLQL